LKFCPECNSIIVKKKNNEFCSKCDKESLEKIKEDSKKGIDLYPDSAYDNFQFLKNQNYQAPLVRKKFGLGLMTGINYVREENFLIIFMSAPDLKKHQNNPYHDYFDSETGLYHYTGKGLEGNQTLTGVNQIVNESNETNTIIHFFRQYHKGQPHQYIGKMKLEKTKEVIQPDKHSQNRKVFEFLLRPID
jgi:hypothetical protein